MASFLNGFFIVPLEAMNNIPQVYYDASALLAAMDTTWLFFGLGVLSMLALLWSANPKTTQTRAAGCTGAVVALGVAIALLDPSEVVSEWMQYTSVVGTPLVVWCLAREGWKGYLTPWLFSWRRIGATLLGLVGLGYLMVQSTPTGQKDVQWALYSFTQMMAPLFGFKALLWWGLHALKRVYVGKYIGEGTAPRVVDVYFTLWWNHTVRGRRVAQQDWLRITAEHPYFMGSSWWQKLGLAFWPDVMEWNAKLGTSNMLWFIQQRMDSPPEVLDDYSDCGGILYIRAVD